MSEVRSLFENHSFHRKAHDAYARLILAHDVQGMVELTQWLDQNGWNTHSVVNQLTVWNKSTRSPLAPRIVLDTHGAVWRGMHENAKAVMSAAFHKAYFFDEAHVQQLQEAMRADDTVVDQSSEEAQDRRHG